MTKWIVGLALMAFASVAAVAYQPRASSNPYGLWTGQLAGCEDAANTSATLDLQWKRNSMGGTITDCDRDKMAITGGSIEGSRIVLFINDNGETSRLTGTINMTYNAYTGIRLRGAGLGWDFFRR
jgi:hypothetical protein